MISNLVKLIIGSGLQAKIAKGVFWSFLGVLISRGFLFISYILISKVTTLEQYGEIGILKSSITTFSLFSLASFGITATRYISLFVEKDIQKTQRILSLTYFMTIIISFSVFLIMNIFKKQFAVNILGAESFEPSVIIIAFAVFFTAVNGFQNGALAGFERFKSIALVNIFFGILSIPVLCFCTKFYGVIGFCYGMLIIYFILFFISAILLDKAMRSNNINFSLRGIKKEFSIISEFSIPSFLGGIIVSPTILICNSILVKSQNGFVQMGIYDAAFNFSIIAMTLNGVVGQVLYPYAMKANIKNNSKFDFINMNAPWLIGVFFGVFLIYIPDIFSLIFDSDFHNDDMYLTLSTIALFIIFISHRQGISRNLAALNRMWYGFTDNLIWAIIAVVATYFLVDIGAFGRALAFVVAYFINSIIVLPFYLNLNVYKKSYVISYQSALIWIIIALSYCSSFYNLDISIRIILLCISILFLLIISFIWYRNLTKTI
ncbi:MAG: oligosaccharide flippase family protein [Flavobacteriaceae bacterium]|nr:oligosaccharide flippase family protein [Flavobacteriaceae bacterium]